MNCLILHLFQKHLKWLKDHYTIHQNIQCVKVLLTSTAMYVKVPNSFTGIKKFAAHCPMYTANGGKKGQEERQILVFPYQISSHKVMCVFENIVRLSFQNLQF